MLEQVGFILLQFFTGYLLQGFAFILFIYAFCKKKIDAKQYVIQSVIMTAAILIIRNLPINFGVHTLFNMLILILICVVMAKLPILQTIIGSLIVTILMFVVELIDVGFFTLIFGGMENYNNLMKDKFFKAYTAIPATILFLLITVFIYFKIVGRKVKSNAKADK